MMNARKHSPFLVALAAALAMPVAFAQDAAAEPQEATQEAAPQSQSLTWADLDADGNGTLSKEEASAVQSLGEVFDEADADKDGQLTADEYRAYMSKDDAGTPEADGSND